MAGTHTTEVPPDMGAGTESWQIERIMQEHEAALLRYAMRLVCSPDTAQDVVQDSFIRLLQTQRTAPVPPEKIKSWLYRVAHNRAVDIIRKEQRQKALREEQAEAMYADPQDAGTRTRKHRELLEDVLHHVRRLGEREQQIVLLRYQEGLSYRAISEVTEESEGNVGYILHHAIKKLTSSLKQAEAI